ncbi:hypothetical protein PQJ75_14040 [Rhodoplanes sp. TEM]|uniref:DNA translocase FtsK 4TM region domain-containing protein n=1 Tax=Rhodoplanes tepidamans TaxID=200616 RepID=A0ABT5JF19_RHOTP|nr:MULTISPECIES: hypothetical protein [Rhodoplanes]MDC7788013.1 hypothetical protein [Rhodoplanes tepidamans]MDC7984853.1 hypothetical protein [Rhodoplanes sp. TEM]MDQ0358442.1 hypothetical protein [Rhodoplanes tepidamans]
MSAPRTALDDVADVLTGFGLAVVVIMIAWSAWTIWTLPTDSLAGLP